MKIPIIDLHTDFILAEKDLGQKFFDIDTSQQINTSSAKAAGYKLIFSGFSYDDRNKRTEKMLKEMLKYGKQSGSLKSVMHIEGAEILAKDRSLLNQMFHRGVKSIGLAHGHDNSLTGSSTSSRNLGLTYRGKEILKEALSLGMVVDLAHSSEKAFKEMLALIKKPPIISHTASFTVESNPRNTKDYQIKEIAKRNGLVGIFFSGKFINSKRVPTVKDVANHIEQMVSMAGIEHIGIGSDFGGITTGVPYGLESVKALPNLFKELSSRGFTEEHLELIGHKNAQRILTEWKLL